MDGGAAVSEKRLTTWTRASAEGGYVHVKEHYAERPDICGGGRIGRSDIITAL